MGIESIATIIPSTDNNDAKFAGITSGISAPTLTPIEEASIRAQQSKVQAEDAINRRVVWDAENGMGDNDADAEGDDDPDYIDGVFVGEGKMNDSGVEIMAPIGIRMEDGMIKPLSASDKAALMDVDGASQEMHFEGRAEYVPPRAGELVCLEVMIFDLILI